MIASEREGGRPGAPHPEERRLAARREGRGASASLMAPLGARVRPRRLLRRRLRTRTLPGGRWLASGARGCEFERSGRRQAEGRPAEPLAPTRRRAGCAGGGREGRRGRGWLARLAAGLSRTSTTLGRGVVDIFAKRKLDAHALDELEDILIQADLGLAVATRIRDGGRRRPLRQGHRAGGGEGDPRRGNRALARAGRAAADDRRRARSRSSFSSSASTARARRRRSASWRPSSPPTGSR